MNYFRILYLSLKLLPINSDAVIEFAAAKLKKQYWRKRQATLFKQFRLLQTHALRIFCR
jgi:hypothetical protein